jgi:hypothetical protein
VANYNTERESRGEGKMNPIVLIVGITGMALILFGLSLFTIQNINESNCANSRVPSSCPNNESMRQAIDYPLITIGVVLATVSVVSSLLHLQRVNTEKSE